MYMMSFSGDKTLSWLKIDEITDEIIEVMKEQLPADYLTTEITTSILRETIKKLKNIPLNLEELRFE